MNDDEATLESPQSDDSDSVGDASTSSAADVYAKWMERFKNGIARYKPPPQGKSPMDEAIWANLPQTVHLNVLGALGTAPQIIAADPMRIYLAVGVKVGSGTGTIYVIVSPSPQLNDENQITGYILNQASPQLVLRESDAPGLVQQAWYASPTPGQTECIHVVSVSLKAWPMSCK